MLNSKATELSEKEAGKPALFAVGHMAIAYLLGKRLLESVTHKT
jgi:hypothetical protein